MDPSTQMSYKLFYCSEYHEFWLLLVHFLCNYDLFLLDVYVVLDAYVSECLPPFNLSSCRSSCLCIISNRSVTCSFSLLYIATIFSSKVEVGCTCSIFFTSALNVHRSIIRQESNSRRNIARSKRTDISIHFLMISLVHGLLSLPHFFNTGSTSIMTLYDSSLLDIER